MQSWRSSLLCFPTFLFIFANVKPAFERSARHTISGTPRPRPHGRFPALLAMFSFVVLFAVLLVALIFVVFLVGMLAVVVGVLRQKRNSSAGVFAINGTAAMIENEIRAQNNEHAVARLERLA